MRTLDCYFCPVSGTRKSQKRNSIRMTKETSNVRCTNNVPEKNCPGRTMSRYNKVPYNNVPLCRVFLPIFINGEDQEAPPSQVQRKQLVGGCMLRLIFGNSTTLTLSGFNNFREAGKTEDRNLYSHTTQLYSQLPN